MSDQDVRVDAWHLKLLMGKIEEVKEHLDDKITAVETHVNTRLDAQDKTLGEIKEQTTKTNGRVTKLEKAKDHVGSVVWTFRWIPKVAGILATTALTILVLALTGSIHVA